MKVFDIKRGVTATMERVVAASGDKFGKLEVLWVGKTAGIFHTREYGTINATVYFPAIDDLAVIERATFNNLIGYALHEGLGHGLYTDNAPWDDARDKHGAFVHQLINGLEDPRIEQCAIDSGYAPNSKALFENLLNSILTEDGYVEPDDLKNIPFLCAVEGRRLNGYDLVAPSIIDQSPLAAPIRKALLDAQAAKSTAGVVKAALELNEHIKQAKKEQQQQQQRQKQDGEQSPEAAGDAESESDTQGTPAPQKAPTATHGSSKEGVRSVEPTGFINKQLKQHRLRSVSGIPAVGQPLIATFNWT
jgi:hypothetical protein